MRIRVLVVFVLTSGYFHTAIAQTYRQVSYTTQSGLPSDHIADVVQAGDGIIWIATTRGLASFDGLEFSIVKDSTDQFPGSPNTRLKKLSENCILVAGLNSQSQFVVKYRLDSVWHNLAVEDTATHAPTRFWDATMEGNELAFSYVVYHTLRTYNPGSDSWTSSRLPDFMQKRIIKLIRHGKRMFIITRDGIFEDQGGKWREVGPYMAGSQTLHPVDMLFDEGADGKVWLLGEDWLGYVKHDEFTNIPLGTKTINPFFRQLQKNSNGFLFIRGSRSFYSYHIVSGIWSPFSILGDDIRPANSRILIDKENGMWITSYRGLHHVPSFQFKTFSKSPGFLGTDVSLVKELSASIYLLGFEHGYSILRNDSVIFHQVLSAPGRTSTRPISGATDGNGKHYIAAQDMGVGEVHPDYSVTWFDSNNAQIVCVNYLKDTLWAMDRFGTLYYLKEHKLVSKAFVDAYPRSISKEQNGSLLIGTRNGLKSIVGSKVFHLPIPLDFSLKEVYCTFIYNGQLLVGTEGGLATIRNGIIERSVAPGLRMERPVYAAVLSPDGIWLGTDNGIYLLLDSVARHFDEQDGLLGWEVNRGAFIKDRSDRLVIGTSKGVSFHDPLHPETSELQFRPAIKSIRQGYNMLPLSQAINLSTRESQLTIGMQVLSFSSNPIELRYRMVGYQDTWQSHSISPQREVTYRRLPPGQYTFEFQARLGNSGWSETVTSPVIQVSAPFYQTIPFLLFLLAIAGVVGFGVQWLVSNRKLSRKLQAEIKTRVSELQWSEAKLGLALENSRLGVWVYDMQNDRMEYSNEMYNILDMLPNTEPLKRATYLDNVHPDDKPRAIQEINKAVNNHTTYEVEARILLRDNSWRWLNIKGKARYNEKGEPTFLSGTMADIDRSKRQEIDREGIISELEKTNSELDRFIYSVSHDLSAPIKSIQGLINLARMEPITETHSHYLSLIQRSLKRQDEFIREIVEYGRNARMPITIEKLDVLELINGIVEDLKYSETFEGTEVDVEINPDLRYLECDKVRLKIILNNLLSNAVKFKTKYKEKHNVRVTLTRNGAQFRLSIEDTGIGIEEKHLKNLFSMFFRATDQHPGSGIGLYIAHEAAKKMGCTIEVSSIVGKGSSFTLCSDNHAVSS